jgi:cytochrome c6
VLNKIKEIAMRKMTRTLAILVAGVCIASCVSFAQSAGQATYKAKCQSCHGSSGTPNEGIAKTLGVKPVSDPEVQKHSEAEMIKVTAEGKGKMPAYTGKLTDAQIKEVVSYFRSLK